MKEGGCAETTSESCRILSVGSKAGETLERLHSGDQCHAFIIPRQRGTQSSLGRRRGWLASYISAYLHPRLSFQSCPDFFTRGQLLARDLASLLPAARTKQQPAPPTPWPCRKDSTGVASEQSGGWGLRSTMRAPRSAVRNSSNPSCWNARPGRLLHSGPNVFVIIPDRSSAPPPASPG